MGTSLKESQKLNALTPDVQKKAQAYLAEWGGHLPTLAQWRSSSSLTLANRASDSVLTKIDEYVRLAEAKGDQRVTLSWLYYVTDHWLKLAGVGTGAKAQVHLQSKDINTGRTPAVYALFIATVNALCAVLTRGGFGGGYGVTPNTLPEFLEQMFGRDILAAKLKQDIWEGDAKYIEASELLKYRLQFKSGLAHMTNWYQKGAEPKLVLANSSHAAPIGKHFYPEVGYGGFVMGMSREIYMNQHVTGRSGQHGSFFHSSYFGGKGVLCAGTIKITEGRIVGISNGSGHYAPQVPELWSLISVLEMHGVAMSDVSVWVYPHGGVSVDEFRNANLRAVLGGLNGHMTEFVKHRGLIQRTENAYRSNQLEREALWVELEMHRNILKWQKCQNPSLKGPSKGNVPTCACRFCAPVMEKPEWHQAQKLWFELRNWGLLDEAGLKSLITPLEARHRTLKKAFG